MSKEVMALAFTAGCVAVVLLSAIYKETPISASDGKGSYFRLGNQNSCPEKVSDIFDPKKIKKRNIYLYVGLCFTFQKLELLNY